MLMNFLLHIIKVASVSSSTYRKSIHTMSYAMYTNYT